MEFHRSFPDNAKQGGMLNAYETSRYAKNCIYFSIYLTDLWFSTHDCVLMDFSTGMCY